MFISGNPIDDSNVLLKRNNMFKIFLYLFLIFIMAISCQDDQIVTEKLHPNLVIKTGTVCGWCSRNDTLTIRGNSVRYVNYVQCNTSNPSVVKIGQLATSKLDFLLSKLDFNEMKKLDLNSQNISFDGCDDWIYYDNGSESHYIRFTRDDPKLQPIKEFVDQLNTIKTQYISNN